MQWQQQQDNERQRQQQQHNKMQWQQQQHNKRSRQQQQLSRRQESIFETCDFDGCVRTLLLRSDRTRRWGKYPAEVETRSRGRT
jgi:hypothetical protein